MPIRILVLDNISRSGLEYLRRHPDWTVLGPAELASPRLEEELATADALVVRSRTKVNRQILAQAPKLRAVGRAGAGVDNIDVEACTSRGILVMNTPGGNSVSAAEHTLALLLALARNIPQANESLKSGHWKRPDFEGVELKGKTLGILGLGKIGREVARRVRALGMHILAYDPYVSERVVKDQDIRMALLEEVLSASDFVSLHAPLNNSTRGMMNAARIGQMRPGAALINCARGELVDDNALYEALVEGRLSGAALDVFSTEPPTDFRIIRLPNVIATPHIAASTREAQEKVGQEIAQTLVEYFTRGTIQNAVNFPSMGPEEYQRLRPYIELGQKLGMFVSQASQGRMEHLGVRYYGALAEMDTSHITNAVLYGALGPILSEQVTPVNARLVAVERGIETVESKSTRVRRYSNLISVKLATSQREEWVEGTMLQRDKHCLCSVDGINIEAPLEGTIVFCRNRDLPGVIGQVGTLLGDNQINIANFALGRDTATAEAVAVVNVDSPTVPEGVMERLGSFPAIRFARLLHI